MYAFILRRILWTIPVLFVATLGTFLLIKALPGNPFVANNPQLRKQPEIQKRLEQRYHLDKPWYVQYGYYVAGISHGDFGPSMRTKSRTVGEIIAEHLPTSMQLGGIAFLLSAALGVPIGVVSALRASSVLDYVLTGMSSLFFAVPSFVSGILWFYYLTDFSGWSTWQQRIGPITVLALAIMPYFTRLVRATMLETLQSEYIQTARSKGLPWRVTVVRHALRNSLIPVVTNAGPLLGFTITGAFITEFIFGVPGIADEFVSSVGQRDYNMILGTTVTFTMLIVTANLIVDIVIGWLDPRIVND